MKTFIILLTILSIKTFSLHEFLRTAHHRPNAGNHYMIGDSLTENKRIPQIGENTEIKRVHQLSSSPKMTPIDYDKVVNPQKNEVHHFHHVILHSPESDFVKTKKKDSLQNSRNLSFEDLMLQTVQRERRQNAVHEESKKNLPFFLHKRKQVQPQVVHVINDSDFKEVNHDFKPIHQFLNNLKNVQKNPMSEMIHSDDKKKDAIPIPFLRQINPNEIDQLLKTDRNPEDLKLLRSYQKENENFVPFLRQINPNEIDQLLKTDRNPEDLRILRDFQNQQQSNFVPFLKKLQPNEIVELLKTDQNPEDLRILRDFQKQQQNFVPFLRQVNSNQMDDLLKKVKNPEDLRIIREHQKNENAKRDEMFRFLQELHPSEIKQILSEEINPEIRKLIEEFQTKQQNEYKNHEAEKELTFKMLKQLNPYEVKHFLLTARNPEEKRVIKEFMAKNHTAERNQPINMNDLRRMGRVNQNQRRQEREENKRNLENNGFDIESLIRNQHKRNDVIKQKLIPLSFKDLETQNSNNVKKHRFDLNSLLNKKDERKVVPVNINQIMNNHVNRNNSKFDIKEFLQRNKKEETKNFHFQPMNLSEILSHANKQEKKVLKKNTNLSDFLKSEKRGLRPLKSHNGSTHTFNLAELLKNPKNPIPVKKNKTVENLLKRQNNSLLSHNGQTHTVSLANLLKNQKPGIMIEKKKNHLSINDLLKNQKAGVMIEKSRKNKFYNKINRENHEKNLNNILLQQNHLKLDDIKNRRNQDKIDNLKLNDILNRISNSKNDFKEKRNVLERKSLFEGYNKGGDDFMMRRHPALIDYDRQIS